jgi:hypothetical protein
MDNIGINQRVPILTYALLMESFTSIFLAKLLGINEDNTNTLSFGNKGTSLSFSQKIYLLIDIQALSKNDKTKYLTFMEIRNQFMHNLGAESYVDCFSFLNGKDTYILKQYPQEKNLSREEQLSIATTQLADELLQKTINLIHNVKEKYSEEIKKYEDLNSNLSARIKLKKWADNLQSE